MDIFWSVPSAEEHPNNRHQGGYGRAGLSKAEQENRAKARAEQHTATQSRTKAEQSRTKAEQSSGSRGQKQISTRQGRTRQGSTT